MSNPTIEEAEAAVSRHECLTVRLDVEDLEAIVAAHHDRNAWLAPYGVTSLRMAIQFVARDALRDSEAYRRVVAEREAAASDRERARGALEAAAARKDQLTAAELARLRKEGCPPPPGTGTRTKNYYLSVEHARQLLPEPVPFELDTLFIRALGGYLAERAEGRSFRCPAGYQSDEDSIGRLLWAAIKEATAATRRRRDAER